MRGNLGHDSTQVRGAYDKEHALPQPRDQGNVAMRQTPGRLVGIRGSKTQEEVRRKEQPPSRHPPARTSPSGTRAAHSGQLPTAESRFVAAGTAPPWPLSQRESPRARTDTTTVAGNPHGPQDGLSHSRSPGTVTGPCICGAGCDHSVDVRVSHPHGYGRQGRSLGPPRPARPARMSGCATRRPDTRLSQASRPIAHRSGSTWCHTLLPSDYDSAARDHPARPA